MAPGVETADTASPILASCAVLEDGERVFEWPGALSDTHVLILCTLLSKLLPKTLACATGLYSGLHLLDICGVHLHERRM